MSLIDELETITGKMSPRFMADVKTKLEGAIEDPSPKNVMGLRTEVNEFIWAVRMTGIEEIEDSLIDLTDILDSPGEIGENLVKFKGRFKELEKVIPPEVAEPEVTEVVYEKRDKPVDESKIEKLLMIPGIGREKATALIENGFENIEDIANAPLAKIITVRGISLSLAKDIKDFLDPNRLVGIEILPRILKTPRLSEEISFSAIPAADEEAPEDYFEEDIYEDDPELLEYYISRLKEFTANISKILDSISTSSPQKEAVLDLEEASLSLMSATRYMGLDLIESELSNIAEVSKEIASGEVELSDKSIYAIKQAQSGLEYGLKKLMGFLESVKKPETAEGEILAEESQATKKHLDDIQRLYADMGGILKKVSDKGKIDDEDLRKFKEDSDLLNKMAGSLAKPQENDEG
ncbi:MAG: helix-hairpin-helix domain-containing protein [Deltaproteobacteria bacterium]|uniref:Helix-hairpin-helix domain-containing protein n=1 Tax=Candidatus Zymogenus saltonus TaxID=2844893 RepID=A0A9D8PNP7_9DELT|nr:helix-hairpin-helix domain-containing protein [Candidatus Zymogenus saltonus]